jgi:hypothetical protein
MLEAYNFGIFRNDMDRSCSSKGEQPTESNVLCCAFCGFKSHQDLLCMMGDSMMKEEKSFPTREHLDQVFTTLQDQITRITVDEEEEMMKMEKEKQE